MPPNMTFDEDVKAIRDTLTKLVDTEEKEVILVVHSYTGMPGAEAPKGLGKKDRQVKGLKGGVVRLVFIVAFAMPEGFQPTASGQQMPEWMKMDMQVRSTSTSSLATLSPLASSEHQLQQSPLFRNANWEVLDHIEKHRKCGPRRRKENILQRSFP